MTLNEKSAYLKGLMDGMKLNTESDEGRLLAAMLDLMGDVTKKVTDIEDTTIAISDELDEIEEDLDAIEDFIMDEDDDEDDDDDEDCRFPWEDEEYEPDELDDDEDEPEEGFDFGDADSTIYEVTCACGNRIAFTESTLERGSMVCPHCGELLEFSTEEDEDEEEIESEPEVIAVYENENR